MTWASLLCLCYFSVPQGWVLCCYPRFSLIPILKEINLNSYGFFWQNTAVCPEVKERHCSLSNDQGSSGHANKCVSSLDIASEWHNVTLHQVLATVPDIWSNMILKVLKRQCLDGVGILIGRSGIKVMNLHDSGVPNGGKPEWRKDQVQSHKLTSYNSFSLCWCLLTFECEVSPIGSCVWTLGS